MENGHVSEDVRPDPTADLHWSSFAGAIQDIFAKNADAHPERLCVCETATSISPQRDFTYRHIHEASNVLAHKLLSDGVQGGDVVMIYAYRGVDLVVAVMGVLKAGAAFSVVDPAYPDDRQIIYLDVARPRALVVIDRASREEGGLSPKVRNWIKDNLHLRTEVPGLELLGDGSLRGGSVEPDAVDVLEKQQSLKAQHPGVIVGPDSQPTLSFTSGSEGIPKGCRGRHFSLTYYQAWMAQTFNLSSSDKFTMLSGIAHDPIQRDIFTPLFLGAQILVPAKTDIQHERLAEWMREYKATVTHLTPAMGQILVGGAVAEFPSLHHAFFVGDILIKRDCRLLQNLAPNVRIVNMYGTTETSRAVSYYEIPSRSEDPAYLDQMGDVVPAGRGMKDVQLLVVDRASLEAKKPRLCSVGESGEIYVRAGGLAEGYLGSDELNREKFIPNFFLEDPNFWLKEDEEQVQEATHKEPWREFWKGSKDRLYRSGDLGRYTENGNVECTGRADNQVKIRGFRIELGEIDTHLSQHPLVMQNVTLVRRDKDEEPTLVCYLVPHMENWSSWLQEKGLQDDSGDDTMTGMLKRFRALRDDARAALKKKLPYYAVPSVLIPLRKFPLNPNGKIDKKVLPYPDAEELAAAATARKIARSTFSPTEQFAGEIWAQWIPGISADMVDLEDKFSDLGGHSMIGQSVIFKVKTQRGIALPITTLSQNPTLREFASVIDAATGLSSADKQDITPPEMDYHPDGEVLAVKYLPKSVPPVMKPPETFLVTGASGFLGAHILSDLLNRPHTKVIALVRAGNPKDALKRIKGTCLAYGIWSEEWPGSRLECIIGDLSRRNLGVDSATWQRLESTVDVIIHNGARVHWIHTYTEMKPTNVLATIACILLCSTGRPKRLTFISSTAVLDTPAHLNGTVLESDDLLGSRTGLSTGYAQTKYVSEYLIREAGKRGLRGSIVRPGYITGNCTTGIGPTDDFLLRMLKGSIQLHARPDLNPNTINLVPVSHCARIVVAASIHPPTSEGVGVAQVTPHPQLPWNDFLGSLETYGYNAPLVPYEQWKTKVDDYVAISLGYSTTITQPNPIDGSTTNGTPIHSKMPKSINGTHEKDQEPHALLPLLDWVTDSLPTSTISRTLSDTNTRSVIHAGDPAYPFEEASRVTEETVGMYLAFMVEVGFIPAPTEGQGEGKGGKKALPVLEISKEQREVLKGVGRSGPSVCATVFGKGKQG